MTWVIGARDLLISMEQVILFIYVVIKHSKVSEHSHDTQINILWPVRILHTSIDFFV